LAASPCVAASLAAAAAVVAGLGDWGSDLVARVNGPFPSGTHGTNHVGLASTIDK